MTTEREDLVRHELKTQLQSTDGAASTFEILFASSPFNTIPDPGAGTARVLIADNAVLANATKWEILTVDARAVNGASDGYVLTVAARNEKSVDGNPQDFSAGAVLFQTPTTLDLDEYLALSGGTMTGALDMGANSITNIGNVTGADANLITGTAGSNGNVIQWNADGDAVDAGIAASNVALIDGSRSFTGAVDMDSTLNVDGAATFNAGITTDALLVEDSVGSLIPRFKNNNANSIVAFRLENDAQAWDVRCSGVDRFQIYDVTSAQEILHISAGTTSLKLAGAINFGQDDLDYYERGSFTLTPDSGSYTIDQNNEYVREGHVVTCFIDFRVTATSSAGTGFFTLDGMPFNIHDNAHVGGYFNMIRGLTIPGDDLLLLPNSSASLRLKYNTYDGSSESVVDYSDFSSTFWVRGICKYTVE